MSLHVFGIRHHGPGCARSLRAALDALRPQVMLMEGPPDAEEVLALATHAELKPPVALLIYPHDQPNRAVYFPFTEFSPEWQALRWAQEHGVGVRLMDLPQTHQIALRLAEEAELAAKAEEEARGNEQAPDAPECDADAPAVACEPGQPESPTWRSDPLALLAEAAGYKDHELWWEEQVERRTDVTGLFAAILEAMRTVRAEVPETRPRDLLREAHMRRTIRAVVKEGAEKIAIICGAWHAPVLDEEAIAGKRDGCKAKDDNERLQGLPKIKTVATWIPWTYSRLTYRSGYGAGVDSPGWYAHLWQSDRLAATRWVATAARLLRDQDLSASSASVIEAVRLADTLAALRELRAPGLAELNEAILTVLCHGDATPMRLIRTRLEVGDVLGEVPDETPSVPLAQDLARLQKSLRFKPSSEVRLADLDVRNETDLARSHLLHRLRLLSIHWGELKRSGGKASTFHEIWQVEWKPELAVAVIEANVWGNTLEAAAAAKVIHDADAAPDLARITELLDAAILAGLTASVDPLLDRVQSQAAVAADVRHLMEAMPPMARVARYGDVRGTRAEHVEPILIGMFQRVLVGLAAACATLDDDAAERMLASMGRAQEALDLLRRDDLQAEWHARLRSLMSSGVHALVRGWCCRLLIEKRQLTDDELYRLARLALSTANPPAECAAWAAGLLRGSGLVLLHQEGLWQVFDRWLAELPQEVFVELLPPLRRAFADFAPAERRQMGEKVRRLCCEPASLVIAPVAARSPDRADFPGIDLERAKRALPVLAHILGVKWE